MDATQQKGSPKQLGGRSLGTKLSEAEYAQCEKSAARRGQTLSEWCRQVLLEAATGPAQALEAEVILSEILALRKIVINLLYGDEAGEPLSEERMRELIEAADSEKLRKATERLHAVVTARAGVLSDDEPGKSVHKPPEDRTVPFFTVVLKRGPLTPARTEQRPELQPQNSSVISLALQPLLLSASSLAIRAKIYGKKAILSKNSASFEPTCAMFL